jgi:dimethylargininase
MEIALTRDVSPAIARCELTYLQRQPIDYERAAAQHADYCDRLEKLGLELVLLPADPACPDCCFVEDTAIVLDEIAVLTVMGSPARQAESPAIDRALRPYRRIARMSPPATLDGGDVLLMHRTLFVGVSSRTNAAGLESLREIVGPFDYEVVPVAVTGCLHLKSAVTAVDDETLLANPGWFDAEPLSKFKTIAVDPEEPGAANVLRVREQLWVHPGFPRTQERIERAGFRTTPVDISEFVKAEAALTCKSILFRRTE